MSTLNVTVLKNPSSVANNLVTDASGNITVGGNIDAGGNVSDLVSNVRTPRAVLIAADTTISNEGVYSVSNNPTVTLGAPASGTIMTLYNSSASSMTLARGSTVSTMRIGADNDTTNNTSLTLGAYSTTTVTLFSSNFAVVTGTDVS